jgi:ABC-type multidrug transport system permease subunit
MTTKLSSRTLPIAQFALALTQASLNDLRTFGIALFTPIFMLVLFWLVGRPTEPGDTDLVSFIFPAIVGLTVMLGGQAAAMRIVNWRQQGVFQRLAATPTPLGDLVLGIGLAQALVSVAQAVLVLLFGVLALGLRVDGVGAAAGVGVLALGVLVFIAFGILVASLSAKAEIANAAFMFTLLPMFFLGGGFPAEILPEFLQAVSPWLPTTMLNSLLSPLLASGALPADPWQPALGLALYAVGFAALAAWRFKWE